MLDLMAVLCGMSTIQYWARSARFLPISRRPNLKTKQNFAWLSSFRYCVDCAQNLPRPCSSPVPVLRVLQISTKSVHFRSFTRTREHHQTGRKVYPVFGWSLSLSRRNIIFFRYRYSNTRATIIMTDWLQCFAFATSLLLAERRRVHCIPVQPKTGKFRALPFTCALPLVVGALSRNRHV